MEGRFDMKRPQKHTYFLQGKGIYFAVASGHWYPVPEKLFADVRDRVIFIAENGNMLSFMLDMYEALLCLRIFT